MTNAQVALLAASGIIAARAGSDRSKLPYWTAKALDEAETMKRWLDKQSQAEQPRDS